MGQWVFHTWLLSTRSYGAKTKILRYTHNVLNKSMYPFLKCYMDPNLGNKSLKKHRAGRRKASVKHCVLQTPKQREMGGGRSKDMPPDCTLGCRSLISLLPQAKSSQIRASALFSLKNHLNVILQRPTSYGNYRRFQKVPETPAHLLMSYCVASVG